MGAGATLRPPAGAPAWTWWREASGAVADLGVLVPIAVALVVVNGLSPTAVLLPAGLAYLMVARVYGVPVAVQPLKAFGAAAIAAGAGVEVVAAGALLMGVVFLGLGSTGLLDRAARLFPAPVIRGVQLAVGLTFARIAWGLVGDPPPTFDHQLGPVLVGVVAAVLVVALLVWSSRLVLVVVVGAFVVAVVLGVETVTWGPSPVSLPDLDASAFATAAVLLVLPQLPLTFANSCLAPADAAVRYFGPRAATVTPGRLAQTLGAANLLAGGISGMPVCHGAGGMSAHWSFGARTARAPAMIGAALVVVALVAGAGLAGVLTSFPLPVLAALLVVAGVAHVRLLSDLRGAPAWVVALVVGVVGLVNLAVAVVAGLVLHAVLARVVRRRRPDQGGSS